MKTTFYFLILMVLLTSCNKEQDYRQLKADFLIGDTLMMAGEVLDLKNIGDSVSVNYNWDFGDGHSSVERNPTHAYFNPGLYTIKLKIGDNTGHSDSISYNIRVGDRYVYELELLSINTQNIFNSTDNWDEDSTGISALPDVYFVITEPGNKNPLHQTKTIYNVNQSYLPISFKIPNIKISPWNYESGSEKCGIFLYDKDKNDSEEMMSNWMSGIAGSAFIYNKSTRKGEFTLGLSHSFKVKFLVK
jgi:hypothetical protein